MAEKKQKKRKYRRHWSLVEILVRTAIIVVAYSVLAAFLAIWCTQIRESGLLP